MLRAAGLAKAYRDEEVVHGVDITLEPGRIVGLVGANGAGKTTTLKVLAGLVDPTEGTVRLDGNDPTEAAIRSRIGFLPEDSPLYEEQTPEDYLAFFGSLYGLDGDEIDRQRRRLLGRLDLAEENQRRRIGTLSKGMKRKVAIARTLIHDPDVLLLDEPTSGLDPVTARELESFIEALRDEGKAILLSAHDLPQVEQLCDEVVVMHDGTVELRGSVADLRDSAGTRRYTLRATEPFPESEPKGSVHEATFTDWEDVDQAADRVREAGGEVVEIDAALPGLETLLHRLAEA